MRSTPQKKGFSRLATEDDEEDASGARAAQKAQLCYDTYGCWSRTFWGWIWPLVRLGNSRQLNPSDLPQLPRFMRLGAQLEKIDAALATSRFGVRCSGIHTSTGSLGQKKRTFSAIPDAHLLGVFVRVYWPQQLFFGSIYLMKELLNMAIPMLLRAMVQFVEDTEAPMSQGLMIALLTFAANLIQCYATHAPMVEAMNIGARIRGAMMALIFRKSMRLSNGARTDKSTGQIVNYMANDAQRFAEFMPMLNDIVLCVPFLGISLSLVYSMLGVATLAGLIVLVIGMCINARLMGRLKTLRSQQMDQTDQRVLQINEALIGIRVVKCNCW